MQEVKYIELDCKHTEDGTVMLLGCKPGDGAALRDALLERKQNLVPYNEHETAEVTINLHGAHNSQYDVVAITINQICSTQSLSDVVEEIYGVKHVDALENYIVQTGDTKTYVTTSVAYQAKHANVNCMHEPWLHLRRCQKLTMKGKDIIENIIGYVIYVWDTREVVQWIESKEGDTLRLNTPKAVDNAKPLKDTRYLLPDWVTEDVKSSGNLWSMANMPEDVQKRYYNR